MSSKYDNNRIISVNILPVSNMQVYNTTDDNTVLCDKLQCSHNTSTVMLVLGLGLGLKDKICGLGVGLGLVIVWPWPWPWP